jgi:hypothetical protein
MEWKMFVYFETLCNMLGPFGIFYGPLVFFMVLWYIYFMVLWYILWSLGIFYGHLVILNNIKYNFSTFMIYSTKNNLAIMIQIKI